MDFRYETSNGLPFPSAPESFEQDKSDLFDLPYDAEGNLPKLKDFLQTCGTSGPEFSAD